MEDETTRALAKVEKLIALTSSSYSEEARTSAFMACKLIREYNMQVVACGSNTFQEPAYHPPPKSEPKPQPPAEFIPIQVKHKGPCRHCGTLIDVGEMAFWCKGKGLLHFNCKTAYER
jgi:hypothetical protein